MFRGSVKGTGYTLLSPVSPSLPFPASPCAITFQLESFDVPEISGLQLEVWRKEFLQMRIYRGLS